MAPQPLVIRAQNLKALRHLDWSISGVCALVGPNGAGKTTALRIMDFLRVSLDLGVTSALSLFGVGPFKHWDADSNERVTLTVSLGEATWAVSLANGALSSEAFAEPGVNCSTVSNHQSVFVDVTGMKVVLPYRPNSTVLSQFLEHRSLTPGLSALGDALRASHYFGAPDVQLLKESGSGQSSEVVLDTHAKNLFTVLRNWRDASQHEHRFQFVLENMHAIFPSHFRKFDFKQAGQRIFALTVSPNPKREPLEADGWADGFFYILSRLTALASVDKPAVIAIDEPENALHPELIRQLVEVMRDWSRQRGTNIALATHSPVLLDCFKEHPEQVFIVDPERGGDSVPIALDKLKSREWLEHFSLGDLYSHLEVGAPAQ